METFNHHDHNFMKHGRSNRHKTMLVGLLIIAFGLLYMMRNIGVINDSAWRIVFSWPMLLVALGAVNLAERKFGWGLILLSVGGVFLLDRYYDLPYNVFTFFWPVLIIAIGLGIIFSGSCKMLRIKRHKPDVSSADGDAINEAAIFGGSERAIHSQNFRGGEIVAIFGGTKTDLTQCQLAPGDNVLEITAIFGGTTLIVPNDWNVKIETNNIFGGYTDKRRNTNVDFNKTLIIRGTSVFGGGELKSY